MTTCAMTEMPQEDMEDASTPEGDHRAEDKRSLRTFAYTASAVVLLVSVFVLVSLLLADLQDLREELAMEIEVFQETPKSEIGFTDCEV